MGVSMLSFCQDNLDIPRSLHQLDTGPFQPHDHSPPAHNFLPPIAPQRKKKWTRWILDLTGSAQGRQHSCTWVTDPISCSPPIHSRVSATPRPCSMGSRQARTALPQGNPGGVSHLVGKRRTPAGYADADWGSDRRIHCQKWRRCCQLEAKEQPWVELSSTEAEYMALSQAAKESVWMVDFLKALRISVQNSMCINNDTQGSIVLAKNPVFHDRSASNTILLRTWSGRSKSVATMCQPMR